VPRQGTVGKRQKVRSSDISKKKGKREKIAVVKIAVKGEQGVMWAFTMGLAKGRKALKTSTRTEFEISCLRRVRGHLWLMDIVKKPGKRELA